MSSDVKSLIQTAMALSPDDRILVAEKILESLDEQEQGTTDRAWAQEAEDRLDAYERGALVGQDYDDVIRELREGANHETDRASSGKARNGGGT